MSRNGQYWLRMILVGVVVIIVNAILDILLGVQPNSGRDWLIFIALYFVGIYFFVWRWEKNLSEKG